MGICVVDITGWISSTLYDSLIHPYISYGIVLWGSTYSSYLQKIRICQKKAIRHIYRSAYNAHTDPLFNESKILKLDQLYILEAGKLVFDALNGILPAPLLHVYMPNTTIHTHNTRQRDNPHSHQIRTLVARNSPSTTNMVRYSKGNKESEH